MKKIAVFAALMTMALTACQTTSSVPQANQAETPATLAAAHVDLDFSYSGEGTEAYAPDAGMEAQALNAWPVVKNGSQGNDVKAVQYLLSNAGINVSADGIFGSGTESAVKTFQSRNGLSADGMVGADTWSKLIRTVRSGDNNAAVKAVQMYLGIAQDGVFGSGTLSAIKSFQSRNGLTADGIVGPATWQALVAGTGSVTPAPIGTTRADIIARGKRWVDLKIPYSMSDFYEGYRTDCSGFVSMAWGLKDSSGRKISANTSSLWSYSKRLSSPDELLPGDAVNSSTSNGVTGGANHVVLFVGWVDKSKKIFKAYEEKGTAYGTVESTRQLEYVGGVWKMKGDTKHPQWYFLRYNKL